MIYLYSIIKEGVNSHYFTKSDSYYMLYDNTKENQTYHFKYSDIKDAWYPIRMVYELNIPSSLNIINHCDTDNDISICYQELEKIIFNKLLS